MDDGPTEIDIRFWPFRLLARGDRAIAAMKWPITAVLFAVALAILISLFSELVDAM
jgi:hypothetical protein